MIKINDILIRAIMKTDIKSIMEWNNQEERGEFQEFTFESQEDLIKQMENGSLFNESFQMLVVENPLNSAAGLIYLNFYRSGIVRIGVCISSKSRNLGIGKIVAKEICEYLFNNYPVVRIEADTDIENIIAQKLLESSGFEKEGILRKYRFHHGKYNDSVLYSKIR